MRRHSPQPTLTRLSAKILLFLLQLASRILAGLPDGGLSGIGASTFFNVLA
jgi:hypothetical protein